MLNWVRFVLRYFFPLNFILLNVVPIRLSSSHSNALEGKHEDNSFGFGWKVVAIGYACGFLAGVFMGNVVITRRPRWFAMVCRVRIVRATRKRSVGSGN